MPVLKRLKQIASFLPQARSPLDWGKMLVLGYARGHPFGGQDLPSRIGRGWFNDMKIRPRRLTPARITLDLRDLGHLMSFEEIVRDGCYNLDEIGFEPAVIIDCGAHIGLFSVQAAMRFPHARAIAFEPNPANAVFVRRQIELNQLATEFIEAAACTREGTSDFGGAEEFSNSGRIVDWDAAGEARNPGAARPSSAGYRVRVVDFPKYLDGLNASSLLLKMDIEGEEVRLMPPLVPHLPAQCAIFFETHTGNEGWSAVTQPLIDAGFVVQATRKRLPWMDGFAIRHAPPGGRA